MTVFDTECSSTADKNVDPAKEIAAHLAFLERLRGPLSFDILMELLEKTLFSKDHSPPNYKPRLFFVYFKHNPELKREIESIVKVNDLDSVLKASVTIFKKYIQKLAPYILNAHDVESVVSQYWTWFDDLPQNISNYLKRVPLVV